MKIPACVCWWMLVCFALTTKRAHVSATHNIVHVIIDDLRPELGAYGLPDRHTPNIDELAANGTVFFRAYAQQAVCGPSRNSFMTGRRPDRSKCWNFINHFRENHPEWTTIPGLFLRAGGLVSWIGGVVQVNKYCRSSWLAPTPTWWC